jgi:hypothetical protein
MCGESTAVLDFFWLDNIWSRLTITVQFFTGRLAVSATNQGSIARRVQFMDKTTLGSAAILGIQ